VLATRECNWSAKWAGRGWEILTPSAVDAFSGTPCHTLLTAECGEVYTAPPGARRVVAAPHHEPLAESSAGGARAGAEPGLEGGAVRLRSARRNGRGQLDLGSSHHRRGVPQQPHCDQVTPWAKGGRPAITWTDDFASSGTCSSSEGPTGGNRAAIELEELIERELLGAETGLGPEGGLAAVEGFQVVAQGLALVAEGAAGEFEEGRGIGEAARAAWRETHGGRIDLGRR